MVAVSLEEQALAPARVLAHVPYLERLLGLVQRRCAPADLPAACAPAAQTHRKLLPKALADYRKLGEPTVVTRALLAQINMPPNTPTTSDVFRLAWRERQKSTTMSSGCARSTCTCLSRLHHVCAARLRTRRCQPRCQLPFLRLHLARRRCPYSVEVRVFAQSTWPLCRVVCPSSALHGCPARNQRLAPRACPNPAAPLFRSRDGALVGTVLPKPATADFLLQALAARPSATDVP